MSREFIEVGYRAKFIFRTTGEKIIYNGDKLCFGSKSFNQVRTNVTGTTDYENALVYKYFCSITHLFFSGIVSNFTLPRISKIISLASPVPYGLSILDISRYKILLSISSDALLIISDV